jgi:hypothetical protein
MIQRIQTVYLALGAILLAGLFFINYYRAESTSTETPLTTVEVNAFQVTTTQVAEQTTINTQFPIFPFTFTALVIILTGLTIFWYKNRTRQNLLARFLVLLDSGLIVALLFSVDKAKDILTGIPYKSGFSPVIALPVIALVLFFLAGRAIMKDEQKIRSADRLR